MTKPSTPRGRAACLALALLGAPLALAQSSAGTTPAPSVPAPKVSKDARNKAGRKVIKLEAITVEGRIQKPTS